MADLSNNTVQLVISKQSKYLEAIAFDEIAPGMLLRWVGVDTVRKHDQDEGTIEPLFAVENPYWGKEISDNYYPGERVMIRECRHGDEIITWAHPNHTFIYGDHLISAGSGALKSVADPLTVSEYSVVGVCLETLGLITEFQRITIHVY